MELIAENKLAVLKCTLRIRFSKTPVEICSVEIELKAAENCAEDTAAVDFMNPSNAPLDTSRADTRVVMLPVDESKLLSLVVNVEVLLSRLVILVCNVEIELKAETN